jgi:hypothetical protein
MIWLFADPQLMPLEDAIVADPNPLLWLLQQEAWQFAMTDLDPAGIEAVSVIPTQLLGDGDQSDALPAIRAWTGGMPGSSTAAKGAVLAWRSCARAPPRRP